MLFFFNRESIYFCPYIKTSSLREDLETVGDSSLVAMQVILVHLVDVLLIITALVVISKNGVIVIMGWL